jgi:hypothetical protein
MWRRLISRAHPDAGGDHELFIWTGAVRDVVCSLERILYTCREFLLAYGKFAARRRSRPRTLRSRR